jgi:hypothetical protein
VRSFFRGRRYMVVLAAIVTAVFVTSLVLPAFGQPSPLTLAKRALSTAKKANRTASTANRRSRRALAEAVKPGPTGPQGPQGATGAQGPTGPGGPAGPAGTAKGWAHIISGTPNVDGMRNPSGVPGRNSANFTGVTASSVEGTYCVSFTGLSPTSNPAVVSVAPPNTGTGDRANYARWLTESGSGCPAGTYVVRTGRVFFGTSGSTDLANNVSFTIAVY